MASLKDKTLSDRGRRELSFSDHHKVKELLPGHFLEDYPKLVSFLEHYMEFEDDSRSPTSLINKLFESRDITAADISLLTFIEDELLLGEQYFEGFQNKRAAARYSNTFYRSKGTLFSLQQFFRSFFDISPDIEYTKKFVFNIGESPIGPESIRFIQDDKLYQQYALRVKAELPLSKWNEAYKLFAHPAGIYLGAEVQATDISNNSIVTAPDAIKANNLDKIVLEVGTVAPLIPTNNHVEVTGLVFQRFGFPFGTGASQTVDSNEVFHRIKLPGQFDDIDSNLSIEQLDRQYDTIKELVGTKTPTFDETDSAGDTRTPRFSSVQDTFDEIKHDWNDQRLEKYPLLDSADWPSRLNRPYNNPFRA